MVYTGRSRKIFNDHLSRWLEPQTGAVLDFNSSFLYEVENQTNEIYFDISSPKSEISSNSWNSPLFKGEPESSNNTLGLRGGSGHGASLSGANTRPGSASAGSSRPGTSPRVRSQAGPSSPIRKPKDTRLRENPLSATSQDEMRRLSSASSNLESSLLNEDQQQSDLQQTQTDLQQQTQTDLQQTPSDSGDSSSSEGTQINLGDSNSSDFFQLEQEEQQNVFQKCTSTIKNCCNPPAESNTSDTLPPQVEPGQELDAPILQMIQKRPDSATEKYIHPDANHITLNQRIHDLDRKQAIYGVVCEGRVELRNKMVNNQIEPSAETLANPENVIYGQDVFLKCPLGKDRKQASDEFVTMLAKVNRRKSEQNSSFKPFIYNESSLERAGLQATFSILNQRTSTDSNDCGKLDVVIWADTDKQTNKVTGVNVLVLGDVPYNERNTILSKVRKVKDKILQSLPKLTEYTNSAKKKKFNWTLIDNHQFDHYIFKNDATNLGLNYEDGATHHVPAVFNTERPTNFDPERTANFETTLAEDSVREGARLVDSFNPNNLFDKATENTRIPHGPNTNILLQQESSIKIGFVESSRFSENKERALRIDVTDFKLTANQKKEIGARPYELDSQTNKFRVPTTPATGKLYDICGTQKIHKACYNCMRQVNGHLDELRSNYFLQDKAQLPGMIQEFGNWFKQVKVLTQIQHNLLDLNKNNPETLCAQQILKHKANATLDQIIDAVVQVKVHNGQSTSHKQVNKSITEKVNIIENDCKISDAASLTKNVNTARVNIKSFALDQNQADKTKSFLAQSPIINNHLKTSSRYLVNKIGNESLFLPGIVVDPDYPWVC